MQLGASRARLDVDGASQVLLWVRGYHETVGRRWRRRKKRRRRKKKKKSAGLSSERSAAFKT